MAALSVLYIAAVEIFLFQGKTANNQQQTFLKSFYVVFLALPSILAVLILIAAPDFFMRGYEYRAFSVTERLMTESRVLWDYIHWILTPDTRQYTFYHDNYTVSSGLLTPASTLAAILAISATLTAAFLFRHKLPWLGFGIRSEEHTS